MEERDIKDSWWREEKVGQERAKQVDIWPGRREIGNNEL
jgi:hypothetical protein